MKTHHMFFATLLMDVFNEIIISGCFPNCLKNARVIPLFKSGDKMEVNNYRPISILQVMSKILEKLLISRLTGFLNQNDVLYKHQFGFRTGSSTWIAASELVDSIYDCMDTKKSMGVIFLDLKKAFDTIDHTILLHKLDCYGIRGKANDLIKSYLSGRSQQVFINGVLSSKNLCRWESLKAVIWGHCCFFCT